MIVLKAGLAWHFRRYSKDEKLQALEDQARAEKVGLWKDKNPIPPWEWRRGVRD
ncbi:MAG: thermonuclease family protein [Robiginitalea sp.]|uniref:thermonuclease family protein n=1 Tax=Robiginitalea sp. TaxID=1902411 RepID=UPI003C753AC4